MPVAGCRRRSPARCRRPRFLETSGAQDKTTDVKHAAAPLFNDLDAADTLDELLAIQASSENQDRLAACEFGVPSWWHEFKRRFADRKRELEARETAFRPERPGELAER